MPRSGRPSLRALPACTLALALFACASTSQDSPVAPRPVAPSRVQLPEGATLDVRGSVRVANGDYLRPALGPNLLAGVILLENLEGVTLDLEGVALRGTRRGTDLDRNRGLGIVVRDCKDVRIVGGELGGYKGCIVVERSRGVVIEGVEFDGWFGQRLLSTVSAENGSDWLWPHENDRGEWLTNYGAAISVTDSEDVTIRDCRGRHGQNGILLTRTTSSEVYDNDFSFLSGWGLAMYRSSRNVVSHNVFDYCVRGYSHGVYWRGQDSAGILIFERCADNVFAYNSATHGGDGVFLYGGQDLVEGRAFERGEYDAGGSDRNLFYANDLSYAVANSLEATFSSHNVAIKNRLNGSHQHGVWGGYSNNMVLFDNEIHGSFGGGITIEHGQDCLIAQNSLRDNLKAVELYWDEDPHLVNGPFGKHRDTSSRGHWLIGNVFAENDTDLRLVTTTGVTFANNRFPYQNRRLEISELRSEADPGLDPLLVREWMAGPENTMPSGLISDVTLRRFDGRVHPRLEEVQTLQPPEVPGSKVTYALERGVRSGGLETIVMGEWGPWDFRSSEPRPEQLLPGGELAGVRWSAVWFPWERTTHDPRADLDAWRALRFEPYLRKEVTGWIDPWAADAEVREAVGADYFGLIATAEVPIVREGLYVLKVVSDDGVRVRVDGETVLEDWTWHAPREVTAQLQLTAGSHAFELEYFQIYGAASLTLHLEPVAP